MKSLILVAATMLLAFSAQAQQFGDQHSLDWDRGGWDRPGRPGPGPGPGRPGHGGPGGWDREREVSLTCESENRREAFCDAGGRITRILRFQTISNATCDGNWSFQGSTITVRNGCRARIVALISERGRPGGPGYPGPGYPGPRPPRTGTISCESRDYGFSSCRGEGAIRSVDSVQQTSRTRCESAGPNRNFGIDRDSVWVDRGCSLVVRVTYY